MTTEMEVPAAHGLAGKKDVGSLSVERQSIDAIYREVLRRICTLEYRFKRRLGETELAREFGVSRTPVREVLQRLESDGLVDVRHGVGNIVIAGDPTSVNDIYNLRLEIAEMIPRLSPRPIEVVHSEAVAGILETVRNSQTPIQHADFFDVNARMHGIVNSLIGNVELAKLHDLYYFKIAPFWYALALENFQLEIDGLVAEATETQAAMLLGDIVAVAHIHRNHTSYGMIRVQRRLSEPGPEIASV